VNLSGKRTLRHPHRQGFQQGGLLAVPRNHQRIRPQLKQRSGQSFTICFDSQVNHWFDVVRAIQRLKKHFDNLLIATLPLMGRAKMDIDDYIRDFGAEAYKRVIDRAVPYQTWIKLVRV
jgi:hypothetical protein